MGNKTLVDCALSALLLTTLAVRLTSSSDVFGDPKASAADGLLLSIIPNDITRLSQTSGDTATVEDIQPESLSDILVKSIIEELTEELRQKSTSRRDPSLRGIYCGNGTEVVEPQMFDELIIYQQRARQLTKELLETYATSHSFKSWAVLASRYHQRSDVALVPLLPELPSGEPSYYRINVEKEPSPHPHQMIPKMHIYKDFTQGKSETHQSLAIVEPLLLEGQHVQAKNFFKAETKVGTHKSPSPVEPILLDVQHDAKEEETHTFMSLDPPLGVILQSQLRTVQLHMAAVEQVMLDQAMNRDSNPGVLKGLHRVLSGLERLSDQLLRILSDCRLDPERGHVEEVVGAVYQRVDVDGALVRGVRTLRQTLKGLDYYKSCLEPIVK